MKLILCGACHRTLEFEEETKTELTKEVLENMMVSCPSHGRYRLGDTKYLIAEIVE